VILGGKLVACTNAAGAGNPVTGYSLTYRRLFELEVRLLEKSGLVRVVYLVSWYCDEVLWQKQSIGIWFATTLEI